MKYLLTFLLIPAFFCSSAQKFTHADSLRGNLSRERSSFDVQHYKLSVRLDIPNKSIQGSNEISFQVVQATPKIQIDLFANMDIKGISEAGKPLKYQRDGNAIFIEFGKTLAKGENHKILIRYSGQPRAAVRPPWDGGFSWTKDPENNDWVTVSCEGLGASVWWPCKDHPSDEPESMDIHIEAPKNLTAVSNGNLVSRTENKESAKSHWKVSYPINTYNVSLNIANYAHWQETLTQYNGKDLNLDYYVLKPNLDKARAHFQQSREMLLIFEKYFGPYPFPRDGYALVETDYWGMEHQSAVAYGNHYKNNSFGFDFIIIHESAHEWFGNSISCKDHADLWIHEATGTYAEAVYLEEKSGKDAAQRYLNGQKNSIKYRFPIVGPYGVNYQSPDSDMYFKGTWMFHTLRSIVNNDELWFKTIKGFCEKFYHKNTDTKEVLDYFDSQLHASIKAIMNFYLFRTDLPQLEYKSEQKEGKWTLQYRWANLDDSINFPIILKNQKQITPKSSWQEIIMDQEPKIDVEHYLINVEKQ
ncbi:M1 family metallopeptidase [Aquirufa sp. ROCK2-A2]